MEEATRLVFKEAVKLIESGKVAEVADSAANIALVLLGIAVATGVTLALIAWVDRNTRVRLATDWVYALSAVIICISLVASLMAFVCYLSISNSPMEHAVTMVTGDIEDNIDDSGYMYELGTE